MQESCRLSRRRHCRMLDVLGRCDVRSARRTREKNKRGSEPTSRQEIKNGRLRVRATTWVELHEEFTEGIQRRSEEILEELYHALFLEILDRFNEGLAVRDETGNVVIVDAIDVVPSPSFFRQLRRLERRSV